MCAKTISVFVLFLLVFIVPTVGFCQASATAEVGIQVPPQKIVAEPLLPVAKPIVAATEEKPLTDKELALLVKNLQREVKTLQGTIFTLQNRITDLESAGQPSADRLGIPPGETVDSWHRQVHSRGDLKIMSIRELEEWHLRDHRARSRLLNPEIRR
jgi:hypothetical protein